MTINEELTDEQITGMTDEQVDEYVKKLEENDSEDTEEGATDSDTDAEDKETSEDDKTVEDEDTSDSDSESEEKTDETKPKPKDSEDEDLPEEYSEWTEKERAFYHEKRKAVQRAQEAEERIRHVELEKARYEAQLQERRMMANPNTQQRGPAQSHEQIVMTELQKIAHQYQEDTGEEYRLSMRDYAAINEAKRRDAIAYQQYVEEDKKTRTINSIIEKADSSEEVFTKELVAKYGEDDYKHVWQTFVVPIIVREGKAYGSSPTLAKIMQADNPAKEAYRLARTTDEGEKYFELKDEKVLAKKRNEKILNNKEHTRTTAGIDSNKPGEARFKLTAQQYEREFDKWDDKLSESEKDAIMEKGFVFVGS